MSSSSALTVINALNASVADCDDEKGRTIDEDQVLTDAERAEKDRLV